MFKKILLVSLLSFLAVVNTSSAVIMLNASNSKKTVKIIVGKYSKGKIHYKGKARLITIEPGKKASFTPGKKAPGVQFVVLHPKKKHNVYTFDACAHSFLKKTKLTINDYDKK